MNWLVWVKLVLLVLFYVGLTIWSCYMDGGYCDGGDEWNTGTWIIFIVQMVCLGPGLLLAVRH